MYKNLKFSYAHFFAFIALIAIGAFSFIGLTYAVDDSVHPFLLPSILTASIVIVLIIWFIGAQQLKGIDNGFDFRKCIWWERFFVFTAPFILLICLLLPFNHAMNVVDKQEQIETDFKNAVNKSVALFTDYEAYADKRVKDYQEFLQDVNEYPAYNRPIYDKLGLRSNGDRKVAMEVQTLESQLKDNFVVLQDTAVNWIKNVNQNASVWNVFFIGNLAGIKSAITQWSTDLEGFSNTILSTEHDTIAAFNADEKYLNEINAALDGISQIYKPQGGILNFAYAFSNLNYLTIVYGIILYLLLMFPYFIQKRNGVSVYGLFRQNRFTQSENMDISNLLEGSNSSVPPASKRKRRSETIESILNTVEPQAKAEKTSNTTHVEDESLSREERHKRRQERRAARNNMNTI